MKKHLSIITVCRNAEATIDKTLKSIYDQKNEDVEYIVIDGGSTDGTLKKIHTFAALADYVISENDSGIYNAMNKGAALSSGRYVCFMNADDFFLPSAINSILAHIEQYPEVDMFYGNWIGVNSRNIGVLRQAHIGLGWRYRLCHQAVIVQRELLGIAPFDERYKICADFDAIQKWIAAGACTKHIPSALVQFSEEGLSNKAVSRACAECLEIAIKRFGLRKSWRFCSYITFYWISSIIKNYRKKKIE
jgi:putative colanic acid biosynthesis glycosyltransferase